MRAQEEENGLEDEEKVKGQYCSISRALGLWCLMLLSTIKV
jgi:hypothetical protein